MSYTKKFAADSPYLAKTLEVPVFQTTQENIQQKKHYEIWN